MFSQLTEGLAYIRDHRPVGWSLSYLGITGALIGILAVLGSGFAQTTLGLRPEEFVVVVLPLGLGVVTGIVALNAYGHRLPRRRTIEGGMIALGILLVILSLAGAISHFLENNVAAQIAEASRVVSVLSLVTVIAFLIGFSYSIVSISSQTQLQKSCRKTFAVGCSGFSTCWCRLPAWRRSSWSDRWRTLSVGKASSWWWASSSACGASPAWSAEVRCCRKRWRREWALHQPAHLSIR